MWPRVRLLSHDAQLVELVSRHSSDLQARQVRQAPYEAEIDKLRQAPIEVHHVAEGELRAESASLRHCVAYLPVVPAAS
eukprot:10833162-Alexandrium_andersonii.AAC.1